MTTLETVDAWRRALDALGVRHQSPPRCVPVETPALLVLGYGARTGTVVFFGSGGAAQFGARARAGGYGFAEGFDLDDPADLAEVLDEWGAIDGDDLPK